MPDGFGERIRCAEFLTHFLIRVGVSILGAASKAEIATQKAKAGFVRVLPVHAPLNESRFILDQPFVASAAYDREEPNVSDTVQLANVAIGLLLLAFWPTSPSGTSRSQGRLLQTSKLRAWCKPLQQLRQ